MINTFAEKSFPVGSGKANITVYLTGYGDWTRVAVSYSKDLNQEQKNEIKKLHVRLQETLTKLHEIGNQT